MKNQYHINSKLLAASGACAAGALLFFAAPATPALAEEMPVVVQEDATAETVNQALTSAPQTTDQTIQDPDAQTASGTSSAITVTAGTDTDTETEPAHAASAASDPAAESAVPAEPAAREAVAAAETVTEPAQPALEGDQAKVYGSGARTETEPEVFAATRQQANNGSGQESGYVPATDPRAGELDPTQYTFSFTIPGFPKENMPPAYTTKSEDLRFVTNQEAAWLKEALKNNEHFVTNNPVLADVGQTPLVDGAPIDAGYYYVICTEQGWFNLLNHLSGHYDDARHWHPEYDEAIHGDVYNITFGCDYSLQAVAAMGLAATYRITPAPVDIWIKGNYTGEDKTVDPAHYSITAISDDPALQEEVVTKMQAFQPECSDFALHRDSAVPHTYDVDLSDSGIRKVVAALGSNYIIRELIADDATYKLNQAGQYSPEGLDVTVMQLDPVHARQFVNDLHVLPEDTTFSLDKAVSTEKAVNDQPVFVTIHYPDGSQDTVQAKLNVLPRTFKLDIVYVDTHGQERGRSRQTGETDDRNIIAYHFPAGYRSQDPDLQKVWFVKDHDDVIRVIVVRTAPDTPQKSDTRKPESGTPNEYRETASSHPVTQAKAMTGTITQTETVLAAADTGQDTEGAGTERVKESVPTAAGGMLPQLSLYVTTAIASLGVVLGLGKHSRK